MFLEATAGIALMAWLARLKQKPRQLATPLTGAGAGLIGAGAGAGLGGAECCGCGGASRTKAWDIAKKTGDVPVSPGGGSYYRFYIGGISGLQFVCPPGGCTPGGQQTGG